MDILASLNKRAAQLNPGRAAVVAPVAVQDDGHGVYIVRTQGKRSHLAQFFVNALEAKQIARGRMNKNLDSQLKL